MPRDNGRLSFRGKDDMRIVIAFAALPLLVFGAAAVSRPAPAPPVVPTQVQTEGVRVIRMDSVTFRARWMPVYEMLPATEVRYRTQTVGREGAVGGEGVVAGTVPGAVVSEPPPRHRLRSRPARLDICARHNMRRVNYGKRWRCRR